MKRKIVKILAVLLIIQILALVSIFVYDYFDSLNYDKKMSDLAKSFSITSDVFVANNLIIGTIEIPKIKLLYPIINYIDDNSLKYAVNKYIGELNEIGHTILAAHNKRNGTSFYKLKEMSLDDQVIITDQNMNSIIYKVIDIYEAKKEDPKIIEEKDDARYVSLITCRRNSTYRFVVVLVEI